MPHRTPGHYPADRAGDLKIQREAQDFGRAMAAGRRGTPPPVEGRPTLVRTVARGRDAVRRATRGKR